MNKAIDKSLSAAFKTHPTLPGTEIRFMQAIRQISKQEDKGRDQMDTTWNIEPDKPEEMGGDPLSLSYGEVYATRGNDEGFGGIYDRNESTIDVHGSMNIQEKDLGLFTSELNKVIESQVNEKETAEGGEQEGTRS